MHLYEKSFRILCIEGLQLIVNMLDITIVYLAYCRKLFLVTSITRKSFSPFSLVLLERTRVTCSTYNSFILKDTTLLHLDEGRVAYIRINIQVTALYINR